MYQATYQDVDCWQWIWSDSTSVPIGDWESSLTAQWAGGLESTYHSSFDLKPLPSNTTCIRPDDSLLLLSDDLWSYGYVQHAPLPPYAESDDTSWPESLLNTPANGLISPGIPVDEPLSPTALTIDTTVSDVDTLVKTIQSVTEASPSSTPTSPLVADFPSPVVSQCPDRPFHCPVATCGKAFTRRTRLKIHARIHDTHKLYVRVMGSRRLCDASD